MGYIASYSILRVVCDQVACRNTYTLVCFTSSCGFWLYQTWKWMQKAPRTRLCLFPSAVTLEFNSADLDSRTLVGDLIERNVRLYIAANNESDF